MGGGADAEVAGGAGIKIFSGCSLEGVVMCRVCAHRDDGRALAGK